MLRVAGCGHLLPARLIEAGRGDGLRVARRQYRFYLACVPEPVGLDNSGRNGKVETVSETHQVCKPDNMKPELRTEPITANAASPDPSNLQAVIGRFFLLSP